jgi:hypothetical protein
MGKRGWRASRARIILPAMGFFLRPAGPRTLWKDLRDFWRNRPRGQWIAALLAVTATSVIVLGFFLDSRTLVPRREQLIYLDSWPADRSDADIKAKQKADLAEREAAEAEHRRQLQRLDQSLNRLGI